MKPFAYLLIVASLVAGSLAAITTYLPRLDTLDPAAPVTLGAPAGRNPASPGQPLYAPDAAGEPLVLTRERIARLKAAGVERVRVNEFSLARWDHKLLALGAMLGLLAGAWLVRRADRRYAMPLTMHRAEAGMPDYALRSARAEVERLLREVSAMPEPERQATTILSSLDAVQQRYLATFVDAGADLTRRLGLASYARVMDRFAGAERQLNRAWSSAADRALEEALACLEQGAAGLEATLQVLADEGFG